MAVRVDFRIEKQNTLNIFNSIIVQLTFPQIASHTNSL